MSKSVGKLLGVIIALCSSLTIQAQDAPATSLATEFAFTIEASISAALVMGTTVDGERQAIPITGGTVHGAQINGEVLAGGADYQVLRSDGSRFIRAVYMIRTDDGAVINVVNEGVIIAPGLAGNTGQYFRTSPKFTAPLGKYGWLNSAIFVCGVRFNPAEPGVVKIDVYKVL